MRCEEIMRRPIEISRHDESVQSAARRMRDANVGFLPIIGDDGQAVGVVTDRDLAVRACARGFIPDQTLVTEIMTRDPIACRTTDDLSWAARLMALHHVARVLVCDDHERP